MKRFARCLALMLAAAAVFSLAACGEKDAKDEGVDPPQGKELSEIADFVVEVPEGRDIVILQFTDTQIIDGSQCRYPDRLSAGEKVNWAPDKLEYNLFRYMRRIVERVRPDFIALTGDNVYGEFDDSGAMNEAFIAEMESYDVPWGLVYGNHDNETAKGVDWLNGKYASARNCLFKPGSVTGNCNYTVALTQGGKLKEVLFFLDTNGCGNSTDPKVRKEAGVYDDQIEWFERIQKELEEYNGGTPVKNLGFSHITFRIFGDSVFENTVYQSTRHGYSHTGGSFNPLKMPDYYEGSFGELRTDFGSLLDADYRLYNLMKRYGTQGWYFGHDHKNNASVLTEDGIRMTYGLKTGTYDSNARDMIGGTKITVGDGVYETEHIYYDENIA